MNETFEGWSNRETWYIALWFDNDRDLYKYKKALQNIGDACLLSKEIRHVIEGKFQIEKFKSDLMYDLLSASIDRVCFEEIAEDWIDSKRYCIEACSNENKTKYCQCDDSDCPAHEGKCECNRMVDEGDFCSECAEYYEDGLASLMFVQTD